MLAFLRDITSVLPRAQWHRPRPITLTYTVYTHEGALINFNQDSIHRVNSLYNQQQKNPYKRIYKNAMGKHLPGSQKNSLDLTC